MLVICCSDIVDAEDVYKIVWAERLITYRALVL